MTRWTFEVFSFRARCVFQTFGLYERFGSLLFGLKGCLRDLIFSASPQQSMFLEKKTWNGHCLSISWKKISYKLRSCSIVRFSHLRIFFHKQHLGEDETWTMESHALGGTCGDESGMMRWSLEAYFLRTLCVFQTLVQWKYGHGEPQDFRTEGLLEQLVSFMAIIPSWQFFFSWPWTRANLQRQLCGLLFKVYAGILLFFFFFFFFFFFVNKRHTRAHTKSSLGVLIIFLFFPFLWSSALFVLVLISLLLSFSVQFLFREVVLPHCRFKAYNHTMIMQ